MKIKFSILSILLLLGLAATSNANTYTFQPVPADLWDLDHWSYYTWGINWSVPSGEEITGADLFFDDIRNWDNADNDLYIHLLDSASSGVSTGWDGQGGGDNFSGQGILLEWYHNLPISAQDITYVFDESEEDALETYLADGNFGLGIDPDCHYYNSGIELRIFTATGHEVPEPATMLLLGAGLLGLFGLKRIGSVKK